VPRVFGIIYLFLCILLTVQIVLGHSAKLKSLCHICSRMLAHASDSVWFLARWIRRIRYLHVVNYFHFIHATARRTHVFPFVVHTFCPAVSAAGDAVLIRCCDTSREWVSGVWLVRFITLFAPSNTQSGSQIDLRTLRAVRVLRPLKLVSGVPSKSRDPMHIIYRRHSLHIIYEGCVKNNAVAGNRDMPHVRLISGIYLDAHAQNRHISASGLKSDINNVFSDSNFLGESGHSRSGAPF